MILLRFSAGLMTWFVILAVNLAFAACTLLAFTKVRALPTDNLAQLLLPVGAKLWDERFMTATKKDAQTPVPPERLFLQAGMLGNFGAVGIYVRDQIRLSEDPSAHDRKIWQICAYVAVGLTGLLIIFTLVIIRRVKARPAPHAQCLFI
jgi:hypothetical protein